MTEVFRVQVRTEIEPKLGGDRSFATEEVIVSEALYNDVASGRVSGREFWRRVYQEQ